MLLSLRKNGLTSLNKEVRVFKDIAGFSQAFFLAFSCDLRSNECVFASLAKKTFWHR